MGCGYRVTGAGSTFCGITRLYYSWAGLAPTNPRNCAVTPSIPCEAHRSNPAPSNHTYPRLYFVSSGHASSGRWRHPDGNYITESNPGSGCDIAAHSRVVVAGEYSGLLPLVLGS